MKKRFILQAALLSPPYTTLTYAAPSWLPVDLWVPGLRLAVPLGKGHRAAVLLEARPEAPGEPLPDGLKPALWPLEQGVLLRADYLDMARQLSQRQSAPLGRIIGTILPAPLRSTAGRVRFFGEGKNRDLRLRDLAALAAVAGSPCLHLGEGGTVPGDASLGGELPDLGALWAAGRGVYLCGGDDPLDKEQCILAHDPPWPVRPRAKKQLEVLDFLLRHGAVTRRRLHTDLGPEYATVLGQLAERNLVHIRPFVLEQTPVDVRPADLRELWQAPFTLSPEQQTILDQCSAFLDTPQEENSGRIPARLLHGVTGSGKTAVYMALAAACLARGKSIMILAPEVALALKLRADVRSHLPSASVFFFHGYQSVQERQATFMALSGREHPCIVVGTRSALFLPLTQIGAIVLDEEHDASFKQDEGLSYQAKEVAWYRAVKHGALLLLGSATPDVKTFYASEQGQLPLFRLPRRAAGGEMPAVRLVQLPKSTGSQSVLAEECVEALGACVSKGEQAIILLNRRGYAPLMYCLSCSTTLRCPQCAISLTYHKGRERVLCHYCGHSTPFPTPCPECGGMHFLPMGEGTEKLEESLVARLPVGAGLLRLDRDSTRRPGRMEEILAAFGRGEASVLVGTQMLSKGHHFPHVTLVVAADADLGLNLPDYRAAERTFQLLVQASGRSGRGEKAGEVIIQTRDSSHYCWEHVKNSDYHGFYAQEIALRERRRYPPFVRLALLRVSFPLKWAPGMERLEKIAEAVRARAKNHGLTVLGPAPAPLAMLKGMRRFHFLMKGPVSPDTWLAMRHVYLVADAFSVQGQLRVTLDLDPVSML